MGQVILSGDSTIRIAVCNGNARTTAVEPRELTFDQFAEMLSEPTIGAKDGDYYLRGGDLTKLIRSNENLKSADLVIIDGDSGFDPATGEITNAPPMGAATSVLKKLGLKFVAHTSHSYVPGKRWKYRIAIPAKLRHEADLKACVGWIMHKMHAAGVHLTDVKENSTWAQAWYTPRVPTAEAKNCFRAEVNLDGKPLDVSECVAWWIMHDDEDGAAKEQEITAREPERPPIGKMLGLGPVEGESIIKKFNSDHGLDWVREELSRNGYKFSHHDKRRNAYRYIRPGSETGIAGVMVFQGKHGDWCTYSHHGGQDPLSHKVCDPFELFAIFQCGGDRKTAARALMPARASASPYTEAAPQAEKAEKPRPKIRTTTFIDLISDTTPDEPDYIEPSFLGPGNFCLIAGPPKAQKSFLLSEMLVACATGTSFLGGRYTVPRPLKVFYLQAEMNRKLLRKRARMMGIVMGEERKLLGENLVVTERFHMLLDEQGVKVAAETIREVFPDGPDIIAIDPLANLFDGESEDKAPEMMAFLNGRIDALRRAVNPNAAVIMVHHSAKKNAEDMNRDPFVAIRGSGALRGYYDTGVIIYRKSEEAPDRKIFIECRSGESPEPMTVRLQSDGRFEVVDTTTGGISRSMADIVLQEIREAWNAKRPLSLAVQTRKEGRYIGRVMAAKHGLEAHAVDQLVEQWLVNGVVAVEMVDKHTKVKGLKVIGRINAEV